MLKRPTAPKNHDVLLHGTPKAWDYLALFENLPTRFVETKIERFTARHGYFPNIESPQKFSEKLLARILRDRDPNYLLYGTKLHSMQFCSAQLLPELSFADRLKVRKVLSPSDFENLPDRFIVKSSFGSGLNAFVNDKETLDRVELCRIFNRELPIKMNAQGISFPGNVAIFEAYLDDVLGNRTPDDYKFHCFNGIDGGSKIFLQIDSGRFDNHRQSLFDEQCCRLEFSIGEVPTHETIPDIPQNIDSMFRIAKQLSVGFDYIRIDLYYIKGKIYFGEYTPFHQGAMGVFSDQKWDEYFGKLWDFRLPTYQGTIKG